MAAICASNAEMLVIGTPDLIYFNETCCCNNISKGSEGPVIVLSCFLNNYFFIIKLK